MSELTSVADLTESMLQQKLVENRRELKRRVESLRTFLWTIMEALETNQPIESDVFLVMEFAKGIHTTADRIVMAEQMLEDLKCPQVRKLVENHRIRERVQAIDDAELQIQREKLDGSRMLHLMETTTGRMKS